MGMVLSLAPHQMGHPVLAARIASDRHVCLQRLAEQRRQSRKPQHKIEALATRCHCNMQCTGACKRPSHVGVRNATSAWWEAGARVACALVCTRLLASMRALVFECVVIAMPTCDTIGGCICSRSSPQVPSICAVPQVVVERETCGPERSYVLHSLDLQQRVAQQLVEPRIDCHKAPFEVAASNGEQRR